MTERTGDLRAAGPHQILPAAAREPAPGALDAVLKAAIAACLLAATVAWLPRGLGRVVLALRAPSPAVLLAALLAACAAGYFLATLWAALGYRPVPPPADTALPECTVVVPAYNEGPWVRVALLSALGSDYPPERLRVVAVDDGSTDDTWAHIQAVAAAHPGRVLPVRLGRNRGKREALRAGFARATGEVVVTLDSDSSLAPEALRHLLAPLLADRAVAAVAGRVEVHNRYEGLLTRLLAARFAVTFDLVRAAQSRFGAVLCCPGALAAYRRAALAAVLDRWAAQTFLGAPCTIGEDRALTTWLLRAGHRTAYQGTAVVRTRVPATLRAVARMLVRWERGNVREALVMLPVLGTRWRARDRLWPTLEVLTDLAQYPLACAGLGLAAGHLLEAPGDLAWMLAACGLAALAPSLYALRRERSADFLYGAAYAALYFVALQWVYPYAALTARDGRWLTR